MRFGFWAYSVPRGDELEAWTRRVRVLRPGNKNRRFPDPLDESEVKQTAYSISTWCWSGGGGQVALRPQQRCAEAAGAQAGTDAAGQECNAGRRHCCGCRGRVEHEGGGPGSGEWDERTAGEARSMPAATSRPPGRQDQYNTVT